jgi:hypothetical protein
MSMLMPMHVSISQFSNSRSNLEQHSNTDYRSEQIKSDAESAQSGAL